MFATIRRIALALAGAAALVAAGKARADHDRPGGYPAGPPQAYQPQDYQPASPAPGYPDYQGQAYQPGTYAPPAAGPGASLWFSVVLPPPPAWLSIAPPPVPAHGVWSRPVLQREYRWLDAARVRFYRHSGWGPWRVRQFEAWHQARRAGLDRRWTALAWAPGPRHGWRDDRGRGWERGRSGHERWERD